MLIRFLFVLFFLNLFSLKCLGQEIDKELKQRILTSLRSEKGSVVRFGVNNSIEFKLFEAIPILEEVMWKQKVFTQQSILWAMAYLNSIDTRKFAFAFIDSVDHYESFRFVSSENKLSAKAHVNLALFHINDYSQADYVIQQLRVNPYDVKSIVLLPDLVRNLPQYEFEAQIILLNAANYSEDYSNRFNAVLQLEELYGAEMIPIYLSFFKNVKESRDEYDYTRLASFEYLCKYSYPDLENLIKDQLYYEPVASYKIDLLDTLLDRFSTQENIKFIEEFYEWETNELVKSHIYFRLENIKDNSTE